MSCLFLTCCVLLVLLFEVQSITTVIGVVGQTVTLSCKYDAKSHLTTSICWGRGEVPWSKCSYTVLATDDEGNLIYTESERYQLRGKLEDGDVSLSIKNVQQDDSGIYGCRVELPGWFNDLKINIHLIIIKGPESPNLITTPVVPTPAAFDENLSIREDYDEPVVNSVNSKENALFWPQNIARIAVVTIMTVTTPVLIYGLYSKARHNFSADRKYLLSYSRTEGWSA
ncbi:hypothetical protein ACEWY4_026741 [Coilia grayii]|uniref:Ig-like domain-containing protein n=1 Tax=Coilia grayii TaxID=363190 RepID=A0ABD1IQH1_9TELE